MDKNRSSATLAERATSRVQIAFGSLLHEKYSLVVLGVISFVESALPIPLITDPFMVAYILAHRSRAIAGILVTTITSLFGGLCAYLVASFFIDTLLTYATPATLEEFYDLAATYASSSLLLGFLGAITPVPFTLAAVVAGAMKGNVVLFLLGAFVGRILRYGITGYLTYRFGGAALAITKRYITTISFVAVILALAYLWFLM
jgi:membrane protein YqaA with SNARE-associated domain